MSNFVYDNVALNGSKVNRGPLPGGEDPNKWIQANEDWNPTIAALYDLRGAIVSNAFLGIARQTIPSVPFGGASDFLWADGSGNLFWHKNGSGNQQINTAGGTLADAYVTGGGNGGTNNQLGDAAIGMNVPVDLRTAANTGGLTESSTAGNQTMFLGRSADGGSVFVYRDDVAVSTGTAGLYIDPNGGALTLTTNGGAERVGMRIDAGGGADVGILSAADYLLRAYTSSGVPTVLLPGVFVRNDAGFGSPVMGSQTVGGFMSYTADGVGATWGGTGMTVVQSVIPANSKLSLTVNDAERALVDDNGLALNGGLSNFLVAGTQTLTITANAVSLSNLALAYFIGDGLLKNITMPTALPTLYVLIPSGSGFTWDATGNISTSGSGTQYRPILAWFNPTTGKHYLQQGAGGGGTSTLAAAYAAGTSPADSTLQLDTTRQGILVLDDPGQIGSPLFRVADSANTSVYLDVSVGGMQVGWDSGGGTYVMLLGSGSAALKWGDDNVWDIGSNARHTRSVYTGQVSAGALGTLKLRRGILSDAGIDLTASTFNPTADILYSVGSDTARFAMFKSYRSTIFLDGLNGTAPFDSVGAGLLLKGKALSASYPGAGITEWSPLVEFQQCFGETVDPESGFATGRMAFQGRIDANSGSSLDSMRISVLGDNGTGTYESEYIGFKRNLLEVYNTGVGTAQTVGLRMLNSTNAAAGAQKYSPMIALQGQGWKTNATATTQSVEWAMQARPVEGTANPGVDLVFWTSVNLGSYVERLAFDVGGHIISSGTAPGFSAGAASGTSPTISVTGTDVAHRVNILLGTTPTTGTLVSITFNKPFAATPKSVQVTPATSHAANSVWAYYITNLSATGYDLATQSAGTGGNQADFFVTVLG